LGNPSAVIVIDATMHLEGTWCIIFGH